MSKKFSILRMVDTKELDRQIDYYMYEHGEEPYLFMSNETGRAMLKKFDDSSVLIPFVSEPDGSKVTYYPRCYYKGCPIYENSNLKFGEVELR